MFPDILQQIEVNVIRRIHALMGQLKETKPTRKAAIKLQLLREAVARASEPAAKEV
jgi:hypothetical protein